MINQTPSPFHSRIPLKRLRKPELKLGDMAKLRKGTELKYGVGTPGDTPEPLTDYQNVWKGAIMWEYARMYGLYWEGAVYQNVWLYLNV